MSASTYELIDYSLLFLFIVFVIIFLSTRKKNLTRQGIMYLYKTQLGIKFIDSFSKKFEKILRPLQYVVIGCGYFLMGTVIWYYGKSVYLYLTTSIADVIRAPPIAPIVPYFPKLFGLEDYYPPLYFTYFIIIIGIVAVSHEFSHGIFARLHGFKIHSTGFAFLGPILGAFVEPDEKQMEKAKKTKQLGILAAGTFANVLMSVLFGLIFWLFFSSFFVPAGVKFNTYQYAVAVVDDLEIIPGSEISGFVKVSDGKNNYYAYEEGLEKIIEENKIKNIKVYEDSPAFKVQLRGAIIEFDGNKVLNQDELSKLIQSHKPNDEVKVKTIILGNGRDSNLEEEKEYNVMLAEKNGRTILGIGNEPVQKKGLIGILYSKTFAKIKDQSVFYKSNMGEVGWFIYYLLWWTITVNLFVALFNMLPLGILDGGKFFYLTIWGITGSEKVGKKAFSFATWLILLSLVALMARWVLIFF